LLRSVAARGELKSAAAQLQPVVAGVAQRLGNTPAVCRKSYIHPSVLELAGCAAAALPTRVRRKRGLSAPECQLLRLIEEPATCARQACAALPVTR
jgi:DNA topoisomerase-1